MENRDVQNPTPRGSAEAGFTTRTPCLEGGSAREASTVEGCVEHPPVEEMFDQQPTLDESEIGDLLRQSIPASALWAPTPLRAASVTWVAPGRFEFHGGDASDEERERAFLVLVEDCGGWPFDIVAWAPHSNRIGSWLGYAWGLGEGEIYHPRLECEALRVWRSPLDWLRANRRGVVLLKPQLAAPSLRDAGPLLAEDVDHGLELEAQLTIAAPRIVVPILNARRV